VFCTVLGLLLAGGKGADLLSGRLTQDPEEATWLAGVGAPAAATATARSAAITAAPTAVSMGAVMATQVSPRTATSGTARQRPRTGMSRSPAAAPEDRLQQCMESRCAQVW
jgi:hypothetical protein